MYRPSDDIVRLAYWESRSGVCGEIVNSEGAVGWKKSRKPDRGDFVTVGTRMAEV